MCIRKIIGVIVLFSLIVSVITGCGNIDSHREDEAILSQQDNSLIESEYDEIVIKSEGSKIYLTLEEAIDQSYCVVKAKLNSINEGKTRREYNFTLEETIIGNMDEVHFIVDEGYADYSVESTDTTYSTNKTDYEVGKEYILVLYKIASVYNGRDKYMIVGDVFVKLDDSDNIAEYRRYHQKEESPYKTAKELLNYARTVTDDSKERFVYGIPFTRSSKIPDIVDASQYIVKAVVSEIESEDPNSNRDTYICEVTDILRGTTKDKINIVLFKNTVSIGKEYLFLLNKATEYSLTYTLSSVYSVVDLEKEISVAEEIYTLISK
ncbi:MAG: hypothetical protein WDA65_02035 [Christensenellales bacterium]